VVVSAPPPPTNLQVIEISEGIVTLRVDPYQRTEREIRLLWFYRAEGEGDADWKFTVQSPTDAVEVRMAGISTGRVEFAVAAVDWKADMLSEIISLDTAVLVVP
jgi:hypothetical protein